MNNVAMDLEQPLKRIRAQIKFGRTEGVSEKLSALLEHFRGSSHEAVILEVYALGYLPDVKGFAEAVPLLERLLSLEIPDNVRANALGFMSLCMKRLSVVPSEADLNNPNLTHFMETLRSGNIFDFDANPNSLHRYPITRDLELAKRLAWNQSIESPFKSWNGLRSKASAQRNRYCSENLISTARFGKIITSEITDICQNRLAGEIMHFFDDIYGDLSEIAEGKAVGFETDLHKQMWEVYKRKAFPCGWMDNYPDEQLCVFIPYRH
ncbi:MULTISPECIES: hypothetical protein [unclassified Duganella]|uniref:hypothetical protein n=1 Tax=unclassified Duganella TaxID=2636909 RepID=UPI0012E3B9A1|nr:MULTISPECIES: hypothetical protein [unclassified Duganella]